jgi:hypothetical protein
MYLDAQQADEEEQQPLRKIGFDCDPPGEPERQELLRLLEEEIASVGEEFEYAEKANEERAAIERDACLAPEGETWSMMLRQEAALDRSIDRRLAQSVALRFGFQYGILPLLWLSPDAISRAAGCSLSLLAPIVAPSSLIVTASAATSLRFYANFAGRRAFCWSAGF